MSAATPTTPPVAPPAPPRGPPLTDRGTVRRDAVRARRWQVLGIAKVDASVDVGEARFQGVVVVGGPLRADRLRSRGRLASRGPVTVAGSLESHGSLEADAAVHAGEADLEGRAQVGGALTADAALCVRGGLVAPSVRCDRFELRGSAQVPGPVAATIVDARLTGPTALATVQAGEVRLRGPAPNPVAWALGKPEPTVRVERIEAERVYVSAAHVRFVRAAELVLGPGARVTALEGTVTKAHPTSRLGPESWSRPPEGLRR